MTLWGSDVKLVHRWVETDKIIRSRGGGIASACKPYDEREGIWGFGIRIGVLKRSEEEGGVSAEGVKSKDQESGKDSVQQW